LKITRQFTAGASCYPLVARPVGTVERCGTMWKRTVTYLLFLAVGAIMGVTMSQIALWRMRPPLFKQYHQIEAEIYAKWLADGVLPAPGALSESAQKTLSANREIQYTAKDGLSYRYGKPYPANLPLSGIVTFGLWWGGENGCVGESEPPEALIHNAKLRAEKPH